MMTTKAKRILAAALTAVLVLSCLTGFTGYKGLGTAYYDASMDIFDGVSYHELIAGHSVNGIEHAHYVDADTKNGAVKALVYNGEVRGTYTLSDMIRYAEEQGYKVIAGTNGDIFDTSSGTPKGLTIHGGNIVTSGYAPDRVIMFDRDGQASLVPAQLAYTVKGTITWQEEVEVPAVTDGALDASTVSGGAVTENEGEPAEESQADATTPQTTLEWLTAPWSANVDFFNVPHGAANGLHLYNRHYASSTKTTGNNAEVVIECEDGVQLQVNGTIKGKVKQINTMTHNTPITDNTVVLSTVAGSATYAQLCALQIGSEIEISVRDAGGAGLEDAVECIGIYYSLVENGRNVTKGGQLNPRTALGIREDGSIVLFEVDGRQASVSKGLGLSDLADTLIDLGCVTAVNLDGGGSSVLYARKPGKDSTAVLQSSPSGGSQRKVANAVLLVYTERNGNETEHLNLYPELTLAMPGAQVQIETYASNSLYEKIRLSGRVEYEVDSEYGTISDDGLFTAGDKAGRAEIRASSGEYTGTTNVEIVDRFTIVPSVTKLTIEAGETREISAKASVGGNGVTIPVNSSKELFNYQCDENIGTISETGVFTATASAVSQTGNITISYENNKVSVPVQVGANIVVFADTGSHWAKKYIGTLAGLKMLDGIGDNMFGAENPVTRAQFVAMLAKMTDNTDVSKAADAGFTDVAATDWYYGYVNWGYENGIVNGMGDGSFSPNSSITREQMAVMLCNYARSTGFALPQTVAGVVFSDSALVSYWAADSVATAAGAGVISGFDTGDFQPQGTATRAQAATVMYKMCEIKGVL